MPIKPAAIAATSRNGLKARLARRSRPVIRLNLSDDRSTGVTSSVYCYAGFAARASAGAGDKVVIAIDAGHGGRDPGAIGPAVRAREKCHHAARKLRTLPGITIRCLVLGVLTRVIYDYFISVVM